jgi:hypothetical protein
MAVKRTNTVSGGAKTKTRSRVRKDGTTVTKTKTKSKGTKSKSRSVVGKKTTSTNKRSVVMPLPDTYQGQGRGTVRQTNRVATGSQLETYTGQSGKAKSKTKVRGKGKVKTRAQGSKGTKTRTTTMTRERGRETSMSRGSSNKARGYGDRYTGKDAPSITESRSITPNVRTKRRGKMSRDIPLPKSNF